jgi:plastocyanin
MSKGSGGRGHTLEIKQKDKQFSPQVAVVQKGTTVSFPNLDAVFHSVFSTSGRNSFDLGSYRSGDPARSVTLTTPGVVEVFCNIHSKMNATILVVPGASAWRTSLSARAASSRGAPAPSRCSRRST